MEANTVVDAIVAALEDDDVLRPGLNEAATEKMCNSIAAALRAQLAQREEEQAKLRALFIGIVQSDAGKNVAWKLEIGQGTETADGKLWCAAIDAARKLTEQEGNEK